MRTIIRGSACIVFDRGQVMTFDESVRFLLSQKTAVIESFYDRFLSRHEQARRLFDGVDLRQQAVMLTMALVSVENHHTHQYPATEHYLRVLGHRHHLGTVPPEMYPHFRDCLMETLGEIHADEWTDDLSQQWKQALDSTVQTMLEGYERPYIY